jgi:SAM-dependent methyltransferase
MITVFTPIHKLESKSLLELCESLSLQTFKDFEWVILLNGPILLPGNVRQLRKLEEIAKMVPSSKVFQSISGGNIGALKGECCALADGNIFVELDYDDTLTKDALQVINDTFEQNLDVHYFYSNCWEFKEDGTTNTPFGAEYGWQTKSWGDSATQNISFPALPQYLRRIEWAPNHVRAFTREGYGMVGGYNKNIEVGDDHDLICRFYTEFGQNGFYHYDDVLYNYRVHSHNTSGSNGRNSDIQRQVDINYCNHTEAMFKKWATDEKLHCLDLGGRFNSPEGYISVDLQDADVVMDLSTSWHYLKDNSVGVLRAYHVLEHLPDTIHFFNEAFRVLAPGGLLLIEVPSSNGLGAFSDPTHIKFFNQLSFEYYTNEQYARFIRPQYKGRFQRSRIAEFNWDSEFGPVPIVSVQMICLKGWYDTHYCGEKKC